MTKVKSAIVLLYLAWLIAAVLLIIGAAEKQSHNFYAFLRWVCCAAFAYAVLISVQSRRILWLCIFAVLAIVFNPIFVLPFDRSAWIVADSLAIAAMVVAGFAFRNSWRPD